MTTRTRVGRVAWLVVALLLAGAGGTPSPAQARGRRGGKAAAAKRGTAAGAEVHRAFPGVHLLALADDQLLLWEPGGHAQLRTGDGNWGAEMQLPAAGIVDAQRDGTGFLLAGALAAGGAAVVSLSAAGQVQVRWSIPGEVVTAVFADAAGRHAVTRGGIIDLHSDGTIGKAQPFPTDPRPPGAGSLPLMLLTRPGDDEGALVVCAPSGAAVAIAAAAAPAPATPTRGVCERPAPAGWKFEEDFHQPPVVCGASIVVTSDARAREGAIVTYAWDTGKIQNRAKTAAASAIACAAEGDALMVGDKQLRLYHLPSLKPAWTHPLGRATARDLAVTKHFIAYRAGDSLDVQVLPRPPAAR